MEDDCSSPKRRKILHADHPESNKDPNLLSPIEIRNTVSNDHCDLEKESKSKIVIEGSTMDATEESGSQIRNEDNMTLQTVGFSGGDGHSLFRKKLLVLDVNGLLVDIVADPDEDYKPDAIIGSKAVFKRPFCDDFLKFCFERFSVGVWTSRTRRNIKGVLDFLMRDTQHQLLFCWDQSHCTETGFNTIDNSSKPLVLKELKNLWEKHDPNLPWDRGVFDESNTLLLDDSPYKALRNPQYTAIFPYTYSYCNTQDNGLGPNGDLRNYLERLAASDNVQKFIEQNPFGQKPITHDNESWNFYHKIICSTQPGAGPSRSRKKLIVIDMVGLLFDVATVPHEGYKADTMHGSRAVFKRPYCDDFLQFCFRRFNVGVWTSTTRYNMEYALDFLMRDTQHKLLFCWDRSHCTDTGFSTVENNHKRLLLKELKRLWEKKDPNLPWKLGDYDESNTLLVDNAPHRALLNPPHTAIFPYPYHYWNTDDNSLGPKGDLRIYLERLAASENIQKFISEHSFGQRPIREKNLSWRFYQKVIRAFSSELEAGDSVDAQCKNSSEPKPCTANASVTKALPEPKTDCSTALDAPTLLEPKPNFTTTSAAHTFVEPETCTTTTLVGQALLESDLNSSALAAQSSLEPETRTTIISTAPTLLEPETITTTISTAPTLLEPETITTTISTAPTLLEPESGTTIAMVGQTLSESETDATAPTAQTLLEPETFTSDDAHSGFTTPSKGALTINVDKESNSAMNGSVTCSRNKRIVNSVEENSCAKRFQSSAGSKGNTKVIASVTGTSGSDDIHHDLPLLEHHNVIITQTDEAEDGKSHQKRKRGRPPKSVGLKQTRGADDGNSHQKRKRGRPPKLVVKEPVGVLKDGHGITTDIDEQPTSVSYEGMRPNSVLKRCSFLSSPDHCDKQPNQAIVPSARTTTDYQQDYQQDWPFVKRSPLWATIESLVVNLTPPQKPHFSQLKKINENLREGLAIAHIVTYWNLVKRLSDLKLNDPADIIHNSLETLVDLETHGFDVGSLRGRLNELLSLKSKASQHVDTLKELERCKDEKRVMEKEMDELKVKMQELQEKMAQTAVMQKVKEEEIVKLQSNMHVVSSQINEWELAFEKLAVTPL